jgi:hypothetical protein
MSELNVRRSGLAPSHIWVIPLPILGLAFGIFALVRRVRKEGRPAGLILAATAVVANGVFVVGLLAQHYHVGRERQLRPLRRCAARLHTLGVAMEFYVAENGTYPAANRWCDLLVDRYVPIEEAFTCPTRWGERGSYAMNVKIEPNSPTDTVLLFESEGGWNQNGSLELMSTESHKGKGCTILFKDGNVRFVASEDLAKLKWE